MNDAWLDYPGMTARFALLHTNLARLSIVSSFDMLDLIQWPAMVVTIVASYLVASQNKRRRTWGFSLFLLSNVLWAIWGWHVNAYALIVLQAGLAFMNIRGVKKNEPTAPRTA